MPGRKPLVRFCRIGERIFHCDRHLEFHRLDCLVQAFEFPDAGNITIEGHTYTEPRTRNRFQAIQVRNPPPTVMPKRIDAMLERVATSQSQHGIDTVRREAPGSGRYVPGSAVHHRFGTQPTHESRARVI
jgi:hypothetical protein